MRMYTLLLVLPCFMGTAEVGGRSDGELSKVERYYQKNKGDHRPSISVGTTGKGQLFHGKCMPFMGKNFRYFSEYSYLQGRAFTHHKVKKTVLDAYEKLDKLYPGRKFGLMELSKEKGGKLWPHHTHQNGMSVDLMTPLKKNGSPYYGLDDKGIMHYMLDFDNKGCYEDDIEVYADFDLVAHHVLLLDECARMNGLKVKKVILKVEWKDLLFATSHGKQLKQRGIYFAKILAKTVNELHDEHFHVDFE